MGSVQVRSPLSAAVLFYLWVAPVGWAQAPPAPGHAIASWRAAISRAQDPASRDLQAAEEVLNSLLELEELERTDLEAFQAGVGAGTVLYYQGRCFEELGDQANSEHLYARAKESPPATLSTWDGLPISILAERPLNRLKNPPR